MMNRIKLKVKDAFKKIADLCLGSSTLTSIIYLIIWATVFTVGSRYAEYKLYEHSFGWDKKKTDKFNFLCKNVEPDLARKIGNIIFDMMDKES